MGTRSKYREAHSAVCVAHARKFGTGVTHSELPDLRRFATVIAKALLLTGLGGALMLTLPLGGAR
jgi:hypothetical protein